MNCISNFLRQRRAHTALQNEMTQDIKTTQIFLKNNPNILITKADKGNTTVALYKTKNVNEIKTMLSDSITYTPLKKDLTNTAQRKVNDLIKIWENKNYINDSMAKSLKSDNPLPARFYGLPKIRKPKNPLRPIASFSGSPTYNLASFYSKILPNNITPLLYVYKIVSISSAR